MEIKSLVNQETAKTSMVQSNNELKATETKIQNEAEKDKISNNDKNVINGEISATSKDGDTVEISNTAKLKNQNENESKIVVNEKANMSKISDASLAKCSKTKLKQLLQSGQISKQQYEKAVKKQK